MKTNYSETKRLSDAVAGIAATIIAMNQQQLPTQVIRRGHSLRDRAGHHGVGDQRQMRTVLFEAPDRQHRDPGGPTLLVLAGGGGQKRPERAHRRLTASIGRRETARITNRLVLSDVVP